MYNDFYGLKERPFALVPDPRFLFLSRAHREALAHMLYGVEAGEGFIEVVGQVGTGKTTLCRTMLGRIGSDIEIAYIFNPSPNDSELLAAINREFGLPTVARSRGQMIDELNRFLLEKRGNGRRCLLVIDEAQNLEPSVLEQIRLLSNLETEQEKLLQIVLIGQPELEENLARTDLRQLRQRITVRWDLRAFERDEIGDYLNHRLQVAGMDHPEVFAPSAVRAIWRASGGVPRVINALADRALLAGFSSGTPRIDGRIVRKVARELPSSERTHDAGLGMTYRAASAVVACGVVLGFLSTLWLPPRWSVHPDLTPPVSAGTGEASPVAAVALDPIGTIGGELDRALLAYSSKGSAAAALDALLVRWGHPSDLPAEIDPNGLPSAVRSVAPLRVFATRSDPGRLQRLNLPAIVELEPPSAGLRYAALLGMDELGRTRLGLGDQVFVTEAAELAALFTGRTFYLWSNFESMPALAPGMSGTAVRWLQARLTDLGYLEMGDASGEFDQHTEWAIRRFQSEHGVRDSGAVGPETLIALYQSLDYRSPTLDEIKSEGEIS